MKKSNKSYNRSVPSLAALVAYLAVLEAAAWAAVDLLGPILVDALPTLRAVVSALGLPAALATAPSAPEAHAVAAVAAAVAALWLLWRDWERHHNGVWAGEPPSDNATYGSSRLLSKPGDLNLAFRLRRKGQPGVPGLVVGGVGPSKDRLLVDEILHGLVLGGTGSGKTTTCLLPSILNLADAGSGMFVLDPKGECYDVTAAYVRKKGYRTVIVDFSDSRRSDGWLPLQTAIDCAAGKNGRRPDEVSSEVRILADTLIPDRREASSIWTQAARILFSGLAAFVAESKEVPDDARNLSTVAALAAMDQERLQEVVRRLSSGSSARLSLEDVAFAPSETFGGYRLNMLSALNVYSDPLISGMLAKSDFAVEDYLEGKLAVYVRFNSSSTAFDALVAAFVAQTLDGLRRLAENRCGGTLPNPVYLLMEEFPQLPRIAGLQKAISVIRSLGVHLVLVAQDRSQIEAVYREDAQAIINNIDTTVFLAANDVKTCKQISDMLGTYTVETTTWSQSKSSSGNGRSKSTSYHEAKLFRPEDLMRWDWRAGHLVVKNGQAYACSSLPLSKTFLGDALGLEGKEPDAAKRAEMAPDRPERDGAPAPIWRMDEAGGDVLQEIAEAIERSVDPRFI